MVLPPEKLEGPQFSGAPGTELDTDTPGPCGLQAGLEDPPNPSSVSFLCWLWATSLSVPRQGPRSLTIAFCCAPRLLIADGGLGVTQAEPQGQRPQQQEYPHVGKAGCLMLWAVAS